MVDAQLTIPMPVISYYDPAASRLRADTLQDFLRAPLTGALREVPGVGADTERKLTAVNVVTTQQLLGIYLQQTDCNAFYKWLQNVGVNAHRNTVVRCIAEKAALMFEPLPPPALELVEEGSEKEEEANSATKLKAKKTRQRRERRQRARQNNKT